MARRSNAARDRRIAELKASYRSEADIARTLAREGHAIGASGVHRALVRLGLASSGKPAERRAASPAAATEPRHEAASEHEYLQREYANSIDGSDAKAAAVDLLKFERPGFRDFAFWLEKGMSPAEALLESDCTIADILGDPEGIACLARHRDPDHAIQALQAAIKIVRATVR
jgi:hypothetical protein